MSPFESAITMLGRQQLGELVHVQFDQPLELEHHARTALRIGCGPTRLRLLRGSDRGIQVGLRAERHGRLDLARVGVEHVAATRCTTAGAAIGPPGDVMIDNPHGILFRLLSRPVADSVTHAKGL
jgi:hypothetical protein